MKRDLTGSVRIIDPIDNFKLIFVFDGIVDSLYMGQKSGSIDRQIGCTILRWSRR